MNPSPDSTTTPPAATATASPAIDAAAAQKPGLISVMCPMGFTPYAVEGLTLDKPLFARVTYRPE